MWSLSVIPTKEVDLDHKAHIKSIDVDESFLPVSTAGVFFFFFGVNNTEHIPH